MQESDRELLELAAKAAGVSVYWCDKYDSGITEEHIIDHPRPHFAVLGTYRHTEWNPLTDDGDALRLAVRLNIPVFPYDDETSTGTIGVVAKNWGSKEANTRRAIVRAAATIKKELKNG